MFLKKSVKLVFQVLRTLDMSGVSEEIFLNNWFRHLEA